MRLLSKLRIDDEIGEVDIVPKTSAPVAIEKNDAANVMSHLRT